MRFRLRSSRGNSEPPGEQEKAAGPVGWVQEAGFSPGFGDTNADPAAAKLRASGIPVHSIPTFTLGAYVSGARIAPMRVMVPEDRAHEAPALLRENEDAIGNSDP